MLKGNKERGRDLCLMERRVLFALLQNTVIPSRVIAVKGISDHDREEFTQLTAPRCVVWGRESKRRMVLGLKKTGFTVHQASNVRRGKDEIWQVFCRQKSRTVTLQVFAWMRDNNEPQVRINGKLQRILPAAFPRPDAPQRSPNTHSSFPTENLIGVSYTAAITARLVMKSKCL